MQIRGYSQTIGGDSKKRAPWKVGGGFKKNHHKFSIENLVYVIF